MTKHYSRLLAVMLAAVATTALADVPRVISYQGRLTNNNGGPLAGPVQLVVRFYDAASGGTVLFSETHADVPLAKGVFSIQIGSQGGGVPDSALNSAETWLGISVDGGVELTPRTRMGMVPFAAKAAVAERTSAAEKLVTPGTFTPAVSVDTAGKVGIGTASPVHNLEILDEAGDVSLALFGRSTDNATIAFGRDPGITGYTVGESYDQSFRMVAGGISSTKGILLDVDGRVGIGTSSPAHNLEVLDTYSDATMALFGRSTDNATIAFGRDPGITGYTIGERYDQSFRIVAHSINSAEGIILDIGGNVGIGVETPTAKLDVAGTARAQVVEITGGSDLAEPFAVAKSEAEAGVNPGMVVVIDPDKPGQLKLATEPYDRKVAGVISGANGLKPGMVMKAEGQPHANGDHPVALTGRVWCWCDASHGAIQPGDLLTTSNTPGHAMKVLDHAKSQGAVLGKAMTRLELGRGLVLVLVTLQ